MKKLTKKQKCLRFFLCAEIFCFAWYYWRDSVDTTCKKSVDQKNIILKQKMVYLASHISVLQQRIAKRELDSFYKEKIAREELQMAREYDHIYYLMQ